MNRLIIMVGIPGSGKSTVVQKIVDTYHPSKKECCVVLSSDEIRKELYGFEDQSNPAEVFGIMFKRCKKALKSGFDVIYDATNLNRKRRERLISDMKKYCDEILSYVILCPIEELIERNKTRQERHLPEEKLWQMIKSVQVPIYQEGFDKIYLVRTSEDLDYVNRLVEKSISFDQESPFHNETLSGHINTTIDYLLKLNWGNHGLWKYSNFDKELVICAASFHDYGKLYTKEYKEDSQKCVYYGHEHVSEYLYYLNCVNNVDSIFDKHSLLLEKMHNDVAALISYHMAFYSGNMDKVKERLGERLYRLLEVLHEADKYRKNEKSSE